LEIVTDDIIGEDKMRMRADELNPIDEMATENEEAGGRGRRW